MSLIRKLSCNVWRAGKDSRNFFVIEKQSSKEEMQPTVFSTCRAYESFIPLDHKLQKRLAFPLFFHLASDAFPDIGLVSWIEKKKKLKKSQEVSE